MSYRPFSDSLSRAAGLVSGTQVIQKFGRNPDVGTTAFEHVWYNGGPYNWLSSSCALRIAAGGNSDDNVSGLGARSIVLEGLDDNWVEITASLATNGNSPSAPTSATFRRINRAYVAQVGTYTGSNVGNIIVETTSSLVVAAIEAGLGQTQLAHYSVPANKTAYVSTVRVRYASNKTGEIRLYRVNSADESTGAPYNPKRVLQTWSEFSGESDTTYDSMIMIQEKSDIFFESKANASNGAVDVSFDIILKS